MPAGRSAALDNDGVHATLVCHGRHHRGADRSNLQCERIRDFRNQNLPQRPKCGRMVDALEARCDP